MKSNSYSLIERSKSFSTSKHTGQSMVEVLVILLLVVLVLGAGNTSPLQQLGDAIRTRFAAFSEAVSRL